ncbi:hypothetical protein DsansV1_C17g0144381 [Dioscorea sansibarensis]
MVVPRKISMGICLVLIAWETYGPSNKWEHYTLDFNLLGALHLHLQKLGLEHLLTIKVVD